MPNALNTDTLPPAPTFATTRLATVSPAPKFRFDANGRTTPAGNTVAQPAADGPVTVTFNTTASTPDNGTPPTPTTDTSNVPPAPTGDEPRVSAIRAGSTGVYPAAFFNDAGRIDFAASAASLGDAPVPGTATAAATGAAALEPCAGAPTATAAVRHATATKVPNCLRIATPHLEAHRGLLHCRGLAVAAE